MSYYFQHYLNAKQKRPLHIFLGWCDTVKHGLKNKVTTPLSLLHSNLRRVGLLVHVLEIWVALNRDFTALNRVLKYTE